MPSWDDVTDHLRARFTLDRDEEHELVLTLHHHSHDQLRAQRVMVRHYENRSTELLEIRSAFAKASDVSVDDVLEQNLKLPIGAIAKHGDFLVLVHRVALKHTTLDGVSFYVTRLAEVADWLEERRGGDQF